MGKAVTVLVRVRLEPADTEIDDPLEVASALGAAIDDQGSLYVPIPDDENGDEAEYIIDVENSEVTDG